MWSIIICILVLLIVFLCILPARYQTLVIASGVGAALYVMNHDNSFGSDASGFDASGLNKSGGAGEPEPVLVGGRGWYEPRAFPTLLEASGESANDPIAVEEFARQDLRPLTSCPMFFSDIPKKCRYTERGKYDPASVPHIGQRKLELSEVYFLTRLGHNRGYKHNDASAGSRLAPPADAPTMVYPGAGGSGTHILHLSMLFPHIWFDLYDVSEFDPRITKKSCPNVNIHKELFLDKQVDFWADQVRAGREVYLVSDIRCATSEMKGDIQRFESAVTDDNILQFAWVTRIRPKCAMLKFRVPYTAGSKPYRYLAGDMLLQLWATRHSAETRLIIDHPGGDNEYRWDEITLRDFEEPYQFFNISKMPARYAHQLPCSDAVVQTRDGKILGNRGDPRACAGLDHCTYCAMEILTWCLFLGMPREHIMSKNERAVQNFITKHSAQLTELINGTSKTLGRSLRKGSHGIWPNDTYAQKQAKAEGAFINLPPDEYFTQIPKFVFSGRKGISEEDASRRNSAIQRAKNN